VGGAVGALVGALAAIASVSPVRSASEALTTAPATDAEALYEQAAVTDDLNIVDVDEPVVVAEQDQPRFPGLNWAQPKNRSEAQSQGGADTASVDLAGSAPQESDGPLPASVSDREANAAPSSKRGVRRKSKPQVIPQSELSTQQGFPANGAKRNPQGSRSEAAGRDLEEAIIVSNEQEGRNPNNFTGTQDAVDPETGAIGTAGTPVTTGYGVSGSTIGTGSRRKSKRQEKEDFRGETSDSASYDAGGRGTGDAGVLKGSEREASVVDQNSDVGRAEASIPRDNEGRDVYEKSEGYVESLDREPVTPAEGSGTQESAGTNIAGTADPRGLGDNTDGSP
jgi:hypothetical protein